VKLVRLAPLGLLLLVGAGAIWTARAEAPRELPDVDYIRVEKAARTMALYSEGRLVHTIAGIQLGDEPTGPKRFEGDERTPEGRYTIDYGNPNSSYHLSLHISYPAARDAEYARLHGRSPGGAIFIHGQPNDWSGSATGARLPGDWTDGCIAVSNAEIEILWDSILDGATIDILP
jgi:murein L,D-transpeptidase YafK